MRIVSIHAHPDDAEILAGGTLALLAALGHEITIVTLSAGDCGSAVHGAEEIAAIRKAEAAESAALIGAQYRWGGFRDMSIFSDDASRRAVTGILRDLRAEIVLTSAPSDYLCDHEATSQLVRDACFAASIPNYTTPSERPPLPAIPHLYFMDPIEQRDGKLVIADFTIDVASVFDRKTAMLACHRSQREWLRKQHGIDNYLTRMEDATRACGVRGGIVFGEGFRQYQVHPYPSEPLLQRLLAAYSGISAERDDMLSGGVRMIPIQTPKGTFHVWTRRVGSNPRIKVLLLHGGPGATHEYFEAFDSYFPGTGIEYYYYDQLGSEYSDQPDIPELWELPRFVEEVEQVRRALRLDQSNFYLLGQSWGGILALEYAFRYQQNLKGLIISNMVASIPAYNQYATDVLMPAMDQGALREIRQLEAAGDFDNPRYEELLMKHYYVDHILRMPLSEWPDPVKRSFRKINRKIYIPMQGPSELGGSGKLAGWDRTADLPGIAVPTLAIGARYDTMEPAQMERIARDVKRGRYLFCPRGSHLAIYDDQKVYMEGIVEFIFDVDAGRV